jgi:hypothetical protein
MRGVCRVTLLARCEVLALAAWHGIPQHHLPTHVPPSATRHTHTPTQADNKSPADPVSRGTLPTAPAPTPRSCKRLRFFHGRTAARRQMGKWATVRVGIGMRCHPCVRHHRLLARALAAVASPASEDHTGSTLSWCRSLAHACCGGASHLPSPMG